MYIVTGGDFVYLVVGANGFLGSYVLKNIISGCDDSIIATYHGEFPSDSCDKITWIKCDVTSPDDIVNLKGFISDVTECRIFYFAACHNLDLVKREPEFAESINVTALGNFLDVFRDAKCLYFSSTDCVYGENTAEFPIFKECDPLNPVNEYGRQKIGAEKLVLRYGFNVVRLPFMTGKSLLGYKKHFLDNVIDKASNGEKFTLADGLYRSALDYESVANLLFTLSRRDNVPQILNVCGDDKLSKYDVGEMIRERYSLPRENIVKVDESEIQKLFFERRASSTVMDNSKLKDFLKLDEIKMKI